MFLRTFAKLRKANISFVMSVRLSVCPGGTTQLHWTDFHKIWYMNIFSNICRENSSFIKNNRYFTWRPIYIFDHIELSSS